MLVEIAEGVFVNPSKVLMLHDGGEAVSIYIDGYHYATYINGVKAKEVAKIINNSEEEENGRS